MAEVGAEVGTAAATVTATGRRLRAPLPWPAWRGLVAWLEAERPQWFNWLPVALGCGIAVYFALPSEPSLAAAIAPLPVALLLWLLVRRGSIAAALLGVLVAACLGLALAKLRSDSIAAPVLERRMGPVEVRGFVELVEPRETRGERLTIRVTSIDGVNRDRTPSRVRIRTMNSPAEGVTLKPGDAVRVKAHLAPPSGPVLPGGYDFARGAYFQGLGGIGYALSRAALDREAGSAPDGLALPAAIARLRHDISARVTAALPGQTGAIATALISGERGAISTVTNDAYRDSGLYHVLSISGLHMAIMGGAVFYAVRIALALFPAIALRYPVKKWAAATAILASLGYLAISGAAFATVRSAVTITIMFLAVLLDRPAIAMRNVALSALLILLVWPESLNDVGFQMSFSAVVALVASYESLRRRLLRRAQWPEGAMAKAALFVGGIVLS
ncbi:MAG: ComEC/Rec2 family competence protein, partial [Hyphomicrobium sp.]